MRTYLKGGSSRVQATDVGHLLEVSTNLHYERGGVLHPETIPSWEDMSLPKAASLRSYFLFQEDGGA
jgi:hypothetical protein